MEATKEVDHYVCWICGYAPCACEEETTKTTVYNYTNGGLLEATQAAIGMNDESLTKCLDRLENYGADMLVIAPDYAPLSFHFGLYRRTEEGEHMIEGERCQLYLNGGIIFHGKHDNGGDGSAPTFSVNLTPCNGWSIHT